MDFKEKLLKKIEIYKLTDSIEIKELINIISDTQVELDLDFDLVQSMKNQQEEIEHFEKDLFSE